MNLSNRHLADLRASGLDDATIAALRVSTQADPMLIAQRLGWKRWPKARGAALEFPYFDPDVKEPCFYRYKPDQPREGIKYEQPKGLAAAPYIIPDSVKDDRLVDPTRPLIFTEGEKKTATLYKLGYAVIGGPGVDNFHEHTPKGPRLHHLIRKHAVLGRRTVVVFFDNDSFAKSKGGSGPHPAAERLCHYLRDAGASGDIFFTLPPKGDAKGVDDFYVARGGSHIFGAGHTDDPGARAVAELIARPHSRLQARSPKPKDTRVEVRRRDDELATNDEVISTLISRADLYERGAELVEVGDGRIIAMKPSRVRELITATVAFYSIDDKGQQAPESIPREMSAQVHGRGRWGARELGGVVQLPVMKPDGTVLDRPGYDEATKLFYAPRLTVQPIPAAPTSEHVGAALRLILGHLTHFPFKEDSDRGTAVAAMLTPFARPTYHGPTAPLVWIDASLAGSGKTLLATGISRLASGGRPARLLSWQRGESEQRKEITAAAREGATVILLDNIRGAFGNPTIEQAVSLPDGVWSDRILGRSESWEGRLDALWIATSNNAEPTGDMRRRLAICRLEPDSANPEERTGLSPFIADVDANLASLTRAALMLLRAWFVAGAPRTKLSEIGSYEGWSSVVRQVIVWLAQECGAPLADPELSRKRDSEEVDREGSAVETLLRELERFLSIHGGEKREMKAGDIVNRLERDRTAAQSRGFDPDWGELSEALDGLVGAKLTPRSLGVLLGSIRNGWHRVEVDGNVICQMRAVRRTLKGSAIWAIERGGWGGCAKSTSTPHIHPNKTNDSEGLGSGGGCGVLDLENHAHSRARAGAHARVYARSEDPNPTTSTPGADASVITRDSGVDVVSEQSTPTSTPSTPTSTPPAPRTPFPADLDGPPSSSLDDGPEEAWSAERCALEEGARW